ncbi:MAG: hypothetical protein K2I09_04920 [Duncaniella sp.]|nr:hypothetical protein [Duncaniella sp.]
MAVAANNTNLFIKYLLQINRYKQTMQRPNPYTTPRIKRIAPLHSLNQCTNCDIILRNSGTLYCQPSSTAAYADKVNHFSRQLQGRIPYRNFNFTTIKWPYQAHRASQQNRTTIAEAHQPHLRLPKQPLIHSSLSTASNISNKKVAKKFGQRKKSY